MVAGESEEGEDDEHREFSPRRRMAHLTGGYQIPEEEHVRDRESEERERDPGHGNKSLLDRDEREPPEQDEEDQRGVQGPAPVKPAPERHIRGSRRRDKKIRP